MTLRSLQLKGQGAVRRTQERRARNRFWRLDRWLREDEVHHSPSLVAGQVQASSEAAWRFFGDFKAGIQSAGVGRRQRRRRRRAWWSFRRWRRTRRRRLDEVVDARYPARRRNHTTHLEAEGFVRVGEDERCDAFCESNILRMVRRQDVDAVDIILKMQTEHRAFNPVKNAHAR